MPHAVLLRTFRGLTLAFVLSSCVETHVPEPGASSDAAANATGSEDGKRDETGSRSTSGTLDAQVLHDADCTTCSAAQHDNDAAASADAPVVSELDAGADILIVDSGVRPNGRPLGVALCYSTASDVHPATTQLWDVLRRGDLPARDGVITALKDAVAAQPTEEEFELLLGLASLWRVAEPDSSESLNILLTLDTITTAQQSLERAYELCPTDHRVAAWLGPIKIRMGRMIEDPDMVDAGFAVLDKGIEHYPGFVLFSRFLVYADLPATDPDFLKAVEAVRNNAAYCGTVETGLASDPACHNHPRASHNIEGAAVFLGDMYAKAQDRTAALDSYEMAKKTDTWSTWDYQELLDQRISTLDQRMKASATTSTSDDLEPAWTSQIQCSLCHRD